MRRNPAWAREELILALDLYLRLGMVGNDHAEVIELSRVLNRLQLHSARPDLERFRNPNGVAMKLANFAALDPDYQGRALPHGGRLDVQVWDEFADNRVQLAHIASAIRRNV